MNGVALHEKEEMHSFASSERPTVAPAAPAMPAKNADSFGAGRHLASAGRTAQPEGANAADSLDPTANSGGTPNQSAQPKDGQRDIQRSRSYSRRCYDAAPDLTVSPAGVRAANGGCTAGIDEPPTRCNEKRPCQGGSGSSDNEGSSTPSEPDWRTRFRKGMRHRVINFTPAWFAVNMGTGITSILLHNFPYPATWLRNLGVVIWVLNIALFITFVLISVARYLIWPQIFGLMIRHPQQSLFLGTFAMGYSTLVNMCVIVLGSRYATMTWILFWIDVVFTVLVGCGVPFLMFTRQAHSVEGLSAIWLLPVVAFVVTASTGGLVASILPPQDARTTLIVSYVIWGAGVPFAFLIMSLYVLRLTVHHVPPREQIVSVFLPLGPCGQGAYGLLQMSAVLRQLAYQNDLGLLGDAVSQSSDEVRTMANAIYGVSILVALVMYGLAIFWLASALITIFDMIRKGGFPFNMGWWGFTFPLGVFAVATVTLANELGSEAFRVVGAILAVCEIFLWFFIASRTAYRAFTGTIFVAPCLAASGGQPPRRKPAKTDA